MVARAICWLEPQPCRLQARRAFQTAESHSAGAPRACLEARNTARTCAEPRTWMSTRNSADRLPFKLDLREPNVENGRRRTRNDFDVTTYGVADAVVPRLLSM